MFGLFAVFLIAQSITGFAVYNDDQREHGEQTVSFPEYLGTGHFVEATFENWESEYLQMGAYVLFTVFLIQRGSSESKDPDKEESVDEDPRQAQDRSDSRSRCMPSAALVSTARSSSRMVVTPSRRGSSSVPVNSGSSRSRTGRASSWRSSRWWCCLSGCASAGLRNRSLLPPRTARPGLPELAPR